MSRNDQQSKDRAAVLRRLEGSGQSVAEFCREQGLPYVVVSRWHREARAGSREAVRWVESKPVMWSDPPRVFGMAIDDNACSAQAAGWAGSRQLASLPRGEALRTAGYDVEGLLQQLNAMPLEIRVAAFCHAECPGLRPMQSALFDAPLRELSSVFAPSIRERAPAEVFDFNVVMNAALAGQWARLSGNPLV